MSDGQNEFTATSRYVAIVPFGTASSMQRSSEESSGSLALQLAAVIKKLHLSSLLAGSHSGRARSGGQ